MTSANTTSGQYVSIILIHTYVPGTYIRFQLRTKSLCHHLKATRDSFLDHLERNRRFGATSVAVDLAERMPELARAQTSVRNVHAEDCCAGINRVRRGLGFLELGDPVLPCLAPPFTTHPEGGTVL